MKIFYIAAEWMCICTVFSVMLLTLWQPVTGLNSIMLYVGLGLFVYFAVLARKAYRNKIIESFEPVEEVEYEDTEEV